MKETVRKLHAEVKKDINKITSKISKENTNLDATSINREVKHILEDMQSILDYIAVDIHYTFCPKHTVNKVYFLYTIEGENEQNFIDKINKNFPGLYTNHTNIYNILAKFQSFNDSTNWIIKLENLTNEVKHNNLYINKIEETKNVTLKAENTSMMVEGNMNIQKYGNGYGVFGEGAVYVNGKDRIEFYDNGIIKIGNGSYDVNTETSNGIEKNVTTKNIVKSKKYHENILDILNLITIKEEQLISEIEKYL